MARLVITADIHGSLRAWNGIVQMVGPSDHLAVAGDLLDTVYGNPGSDDYHPQRIRKDFTALGPRAHYVYGNCDREEDLPGYGYQSGFMFEGLSILLSHGHRPLPDLTDFHVIIEGHSHVPRLDSLMGKIFLNPGSPTHPRSSQGTYALIENGRIMIKDFSRRRTLSLLVLSDILR
ncbi:phosphodiesterase [Desulfatiferula olefinivorans]